jgi:Ca2+-binding RTX toxin-like protein
MAISVADPSRPDGAAYALPADPFVAWQWYLDNVGQSGGTAGMDINILPLWPDYMGEGVRIAIIDDGFDLAHPDLAGAFDRDASYDLRDDDPDPTAGPTEAHGTPIAGILAAAHDGSGIIGMTPAASLVGLRIGFSDPDVLAQIERALARAFAADVVNNSWGFLRPFADTFENPLMAAIGAAIDNAAENGRNGLGTAIVFAAGNHRQDNDNVNLHALRNATNIITVAALDHDGQVTFYSSPGAAVLVSAPGNGIYTTDLSGAAGYDPSDYALTAGTSFAAPMVSGVIALMLEANPGLGSRDVQQILATSARRIADPDTTWQINGAGTLNGTGLHFSHDYGFGLLDAHAAVRLAESWTSTTPTFGRLVSASGSITASVSIPDTGSIASTLEIEETVRVNRVEVQFTISHLRPADLEVTLVSPSGTRSILLREVDVAELTAFTYTSVAHWGEASAGTWTLEVHDRATGATGILEHWSLTILGQPISEHTLHVFTDAVFADGGTSLLLDTSGRVSFNAAPVTADIILDLGGRFGWIGSRPLGIAVSTVVDRVVSGDGNDILTGDPLANTISAGRGNDTIFASGGDDVVDGGPGLDTYVFTDRFRETVAAHADGTLTLLNPDTGSITRLSGIELFTIARTTLSLDAFLTVAASTDGFFKDGTASRDILRGSPDQDTLLGAGGDDYLYGFDRDDTLRGGTGSDRLYGGAGQDLLAGDDDADWLWGGLGDDTLSGGSGNDLLFGEAGDDILIGDAGNDVLRGGDGDDRLVGGPGYDSLYGGDGADTFVPDAQDGTLDYVFDLAIAGGETDRIDLRHLLSGLDQTDPIERFIALSAAGTDTLISVDAGGTGDAFLAVARLVQTRLDLPVQSYVDSALLIVFDDQVS